MPQVGLADYIRNCTKSGSITIGRRKDVVALDFYRASNRKSQLFLELTINYPDEFQISNQLKLVTNQAKLNAIYRFDGEYNQYAGYDFYHFTFPPNKAKLKYWNGMEEYVHRESRYNLNVINNVIREIPNKLTF